MERKLLKLRTLSCALNLMRVCLKLKSKKESRALMRKRVTRREEKGLKINIVQELKREDNFMRINEEVFDYLVLKVTPFIKKQDTHMRQAISVEHRLIATLRFLATGENYNRLQHSTTIPKCTLSKLIPETLQAIYESLKDAYFKVPTTEEEWENIAKDYLDNWQVVNTIGALDGKHVRVGCPSDISSHNNSKGYSSITLFALVDANYKLICVDVGTNTMVGDVDIFAKSSIKNCLMDRTILNIPSGNNLPNTDICAPYVVLADNGFPLCHSVMKPYPLDRISKDKKIFNYRLSRGRRTVESAFEILANRFRILQTTINLSPAKVTQIILAACALHNLLTEKLKSAYTLRDILTIKKNGYKMNLEMKMNESSTVEMQGLARQNFHSHHRHGGEIRHIFRDYYNGIGTVPWQEEHTKKLTLL